MRPQQSLWDEALVVAQTERPERPHVQLLTGPAGATLPSGHPSVLAIGEVHAGRVPRILAVTTHERCIAVPATSS